MLSSMEACDQIVVNAMMALELPYVREKFKLFVASQKKDAPKQTVFGRLFLDQMYRK